MYAIYKQKRFDAQYKNDDEVILYSSVRFEGFQNYTDSMGNLFSDYFSQQPFSRKRYFQNSQDRRARLHI